MGFFELLIAAFIVLIVLNEGPSVVRKWRGAFDRVESRDAGELTRLRDEVDRLSSEVARLSDEQQFMVRLLSEGGGSQREKQHEDPETL